MESNSGGAWGKDLQRRQKMVTVVLAEEMSSRGGGNHGAGEEQDRAGRVAKGWSYLL